MAEEFVLKKKIYYHDTDAGGVVYYANYLKYLEEARTEFCAKRKVNTAELSQRGTYFVVAHIEVDYKASAHYGDTIEVWTEVEKISRVTIDYLQKITKGDKLLVKAQVTWVCVNSEFKPMSIPDKVKELLGKV